eukprot:365596-Chlamydomonas_euryale.AAC.30
MLQSHMCTRLSDQARHFALVYKTHLPALRHVHGSGWACTPVWMAPGYACTWQKVASCRNIAIPLPSASHSHHAASPADSTSDALPPSP